MVQLQREGLDLDHQATDQSCLLLLLGFPSSSTASPGALVNPLTTTCAPPPMPSPTTHHLASCFLSSPGCLPRGWLRPLAWTTTMAR